MNDIVLARFGKSGVDTDDIIGVWVDQEDKFIKFSAGGAIKKVLIDPLLTDNGKTIGERNIDYLHEKLDEWIMKQLEKNTRGQANG